LVVESLREKSWFVDGNDANIRSAI